MTATLCVAVGLCALLGVCSLGLLLRVLSDAAQERSNHVSERNELLLAASEERALWTQERAELLTRIQRPDIVPRSAARNLTPHVLPEEEKQLAMVGQIFVDPLEVPMNNGTT